MKLNFYFMQQIYTSLLMIMFFLFMNGCASGSSTNPLLPLAEKPSPSTATQELPNKSVVEKDGLRLELEIPQKEYFRGETIPITLRVRNITDKEKTLNFTCAGQYELYVEDLEKKNKEVIKDAECEIVGTSTVLMSSQAMGFSYDWEQQKKDKTYPDYGEYNIGANLGLSTNIDFATILLKIKRNEDIKRTHAGEKAILWTDKYVYSMNEKVKYYLKVVNDTNSPLSTLDNCSSDYFPYIYEGKILIWTWDDGFNGWVDCFGIWGRTMLPGEELYFENVWFPTIANAKLSEKGKQNLLRPGNYKLVVGWLTSFQECMENLLCPNRLSVNFVLKGVKDE